MNNFLTENQKKRLINELKMENLPLALFTIVIAAIFIYERAIVIIENIKNDIPVKIFETENMTILFFFFLFFLVMNSQRKKIKKIRSIQTKILPAVCTFKEINHSVDNSHD